MNEGKKEKLIRAAIDIVAEEGLENFSVEKAAKRAGASKRLCFQHFGTKEDFLYACYESVNLKIAGIYKNLRLDPTKDIVESVRQLWSMYFRFLLDNGNDTTFYSEYRTSFRIKKIMEHESAMNASYFKDFIEVFGALDTAFHISEKVDLDCLWTFVLDGTALFTKRIVRDGLKHNGFVEESIWRLMAPGMLGLLGATDNPGKQGESGHMKTDAAL